ncbi:MAG: phosphohistidine phosphatase SixA [Anaerolineales bacterium]
MILYIIRHAIAVDSAKFEGDDSQRPLTSQGRKKMRSIAEGLKELEIQLDLILTSPYLRTTQTAQILAKKFDLKKEQVICTDHLAPTGHADQLIDEINEKYGNVGHIALIGHESYLSNLASVLTTGDPNVSIVLKKGGICRLSIEKIQYGRCAMMEWLLSPALLVEIGK